MSRDVPIPLSRIRHTGPYGFPFEEQHSSPQEISDGFQYSFSLDLNTPGANYPAWKRDLHALLELPTSSQPAFLVHVFMSFLIVMSALITILETVPAFHSISGRVWFGLETSLVALFTVEYVTRCLAWSATWMGLARWIFCERRNFLLRISLRNSLSSVLRNHRFARHITILYRIDATPRHGMAQATLLSFI